MSDPLRLPRYQFFDQNGSPLAGGKLYSYVAGSTTPLQTYADALNTPNTNPIILDANGEAEIWLTGSTYKFVLKDSNDNTIWTVDQLQSLTTLLASMINTAGALAVTNNLSDVADVATALTNLGIASATMTLTSKTIDGDDNTLQDIAITALKTVLADANKAIVRDASGNVVSALIANANVDAAAAIAYSKLALAASIVNADISGSAAIAYSKLNLALGIVNGDISASAAIALSKLAGLTGNKALVSNSSGVIAAASVTDTELGYLSGVTSAIQTQIASLVLKSIFSAKGSLAVATAASTPANLGVGIDGTVLTADSAQSTGLKWATPSGGSGGGGGIIWDEGENSAQYAFANGFEYYVFSNALGQALYTLIKVPSTYVTGNPIALKGHWYSAGSSGNVLFSTVATLIRSGTDVVTSTTNQRTSTNSAVTVSGSTANKPQSISFDLTASDGKINSVAVSANDWILVKLFRDATDTCTSDAFFIPRSCEVTFQ